VSACLCGQDSSRVLRPCCELLAVRAHRPPRAPPPRSARPRYFCFESLTTTNARTDTVLGYEMLSCAGAAGDCVRPGAGPVRVSVFFMCQRRRERTHMRSALIRTDPHCLCAVGAVTPYCKSCKSAQARSAHALHTLCTRSAHSWDTLGKVDAQGKSTRQIHKANPWGQGGQGGTLCTQLGYIGQGGRARQIHGYCKSCKSAQARSAHALHTVGIHWASWARWTRKANPQGKLGPQCIGLGPQCLETFRARARPGHESGLT
jgi:hypothetical protein